MAKFIYFMQAGNAIKIGASGNLQERLVACQRSCPIEIKYIYTENTSTKYRMIEHGLHKKFKKYRIRGEWYKAQPVLEYLATIIPINEVTSEKQMDVAWGIKMEEEVEKLVIEHRNR